MSLKNLSVATKIPKILKKKLINNKICHLYDNFEKNINIKENFAVSVSGGADSMALAFFAKIYAIKKDLKVKFFVVDHKLRSESTNEAKLVKNILKKFTINVKILTWRGKKPSKNIQSLARKKRYELLFKNCDKHNINTILLGHHEGDLLENFFIRITRGSGLKGLVSLDKKVKIDNFNILRPLLSQKKEDLIFVSKNVFNFYVEDPSNNDEKFQRIRIRNLIQNLSKNGLDQKKFIKTIENLKISNEVVQFYVDKNLSENTHFSKKEKKLFLNKNFFNQPYEVIFRSLSDSIKKIGNKYYSVRGKKLDKIISEIENIGQFKATLGNCIIEKVNETIIISKES